MTAGHPQTPRSRQAMKAVLALAVIAQAASACAPTSAQPTGAPTTTASSGPATSAAVPVPTGLLPTLFPPLPMAFADQPRLARFQAALDAGIAHGAPDMIGSVISPLGSWSGAAGIVGLEGSAATSMDEYYLGNITQVFTAVLTMLLAEQGKIELDAPIASYLRRVAVDANGATVRQALAMRSGLPDFAQEAADAIQADTGHVWTLNEIVAFIPPAAAAAGAAYIEAGPNYTLLAAAATQTGGLPFADGLRAKLLDPFGAKRIVQQGAGAETPKPWAVPTAANIGGLKAEDYGRGGVISCISSASFSYGYGSMASDAPSLAAWIWRLFRGEIISESSLRSMLPDDDGHGYAFKSLDSLDSTTVIGQIGSKTGYSAVLAIYPVEQTVVVLFVNDLDFVMEPTMVELRDIALGR